MPLKPLRTSLSMPRMPRTSIAPSIVAETLRSWISRFWATAATPAVRQPARPTSTYSTGVAPLSSEAKISGWSTSNEYRGAVALLLAEAEEALDGRCCCACRSATRTWLATRTCAASGAAVSASRAPSSASTLTPLLTGVSVAVIGRLPCWVSRDGDPSRVRSRAVQWRPCDGVKAIRARHGAGHESAIGRPTVTWRRTSGSNVSPSWASACTPSASSTLVKKPRAAAASTTSTISGSLRPWSRSSSHVGGGDRRRVAGDLGGEVHHRPVGGIEARAARVGGDGAHRRLVAAVVAEELAVGGHAVRGAVGAGGGDRGELEPPTVHVASDRAVERVPRLGDVGPGRERRRVVRQVAPRRPAAAGTSRRRRRRRSTRQVLR